MGNIVIINVVGKVDIEFMLMVVGEYSIMVLVNNVQKMVMVKFKVDFSIGQVILEVDGSMLKVVNDNDVFMLMVMVKD